MSEVSLSDLCSVIADQRDPSTIARTDYLGLEHLTPGRMTATARGSSNEVQSHKWAFKRGDVLYGKLRPYLDKAALANFDGVCSTELLVLRPNEGVDPRYLAAVVHSPAFIEHAMSGVTGAHHPRTSWSHLAGFQLPKRASDAQSVVAKILWRVDDLISACEATASAAQELKRATMTHLFTRGLRGEAQKETEIGLVPESWSLLTLGDLAEIAYGAQAAVANSTEPSIGTLILTNVNIDLDGRLDLEKRRYYKIPEAHRERLSLRKGDVLFNWRSGSAHHVGKTAYFDLDGEYTYSSFILRFRPRKSVTGKYLFRWLAHLRTSGFFTSQRNVSSINSVFNASLSATIPIWFPDEEEQREIVTILDTLDRKIALHQKKRAVLEELFKSLLHKLMTGEIRVDQLDLSALEAAGASQGAAA